MGVTDIVGIRNSEAWSWVDPGGFALIGAAAFFGGLTRLTFSLAVVMIEITDETHFLLPIMTAGGSFRHGCGSGSPVTHPLIH